MASAYFISDNFTDWISIDIQTSLWNIGCDITAVVTKSITSSDGQQEAGDTREWKRSTCWRILVKNNIHKNIQRLIQCIVNDQLLVHVLSWVRRKGWRNKSHTTRTAANSSERNSMTMILMLRMETRWIHREADKRNTDGSRKGLDFEIILSRTEDINIL